MKSSVARRRTRNRPKSRPRKVGAGNASGGAVVHLTRSEIQQLKDRATLDLRSVASYAGWLVAQELSRPAPKRVASSVRGCRELGIDGSP